MPAKKRESYNPLLKSYPDSEKINAVSVGAETLYTRLLAQCDDNSHYYAEPSMVLGKLFTRRMCAGQVKERDVKRWIGELGEQDLIRLYEVEGHKYLEIVNCKKSLRSDVLPDVRFPLPPHPLRIRAGDVTNAGRARAENGSATQPNPTQPNGVVDENGTDTGRMVDADAPPTETTETTEPENPESFAAGWITVNYPSHLRSGVAPFARLIRRCGRVEAIRLVQEAGADPDVGNPFAYAEGKRDRQHAQRTGKPDLGRVTKTETVNV